MKTLAILFLLAISAAGCDKKAEPGNNSTTAPAASAALADEDVPVKADFTDEARTDITVTNYKSELDSLASEIEK